MEKLVVKGSKRLSGKLRIHGAKNSALPILAASLMVGDVCVIHNCPNLTDIDATVKILEHLGCKVKREGTSVTVDSASVTGFDVPDSLMREMRSSVIFLGSILSRTGKAQLSAPGGCEIGLRPIDLHISSVKQFGAVVSEEHGNLLFDTPQGLNGAEIVLSFPSVGATENIILTAAMARGRTTVTNAAREPEINDLADFLNACGAKINCIGDGTVIIDGVKRLHGAEHTVIPDRIAAATYMCCAAVTKGHLELENVIPSHLGPVIPAFEQAGCEIEAGVNSLVITAPPRLGQISTVRTMPYPGFPTDAQAPVMAMACAAKGTTVFVENIFESRYKHIGELSRMGAKINVEGKVAVVEGVKSMYGAKVVAPDLRGGAALVIAGLFAKGETQITQLCHIDRGYENIEDYLCSVGADIKRKD